MTADVLVRLSLLTSIWLLVLSIGARATVQDALYVLRRPGDLLRAVVAMFVVVPAFAVLLAKVAPLAAAITFAIIAMSVGPVPPVLPFKQMKAQGDEDYAVGLLVAATLASLVLTPLLVEFAAYILGTEAHVSIDRIARTLMLSIGVPLAAGLVLRAVSERAANVLAGPAQRVGTLILLAVFLLMLAASWREIFGLLGDGGVLAIAATVGIGLLAGHLLGGGRHSGALALAAAGRHPGVALAIAQMSFPDQRRTIMAALLLFLVVTALVTAPYVRWIRSRAPDAAGLASPSTERGA
jgi:BASS family bile acid:Na+ symporter